MFTYTYTIIVSFKALGECDREGGRDARNSSHAHAAKKSRGEKPPTPCPASHKTPPALGQVVLPALSGNRSLQRLVGEYYDTLDLASASPPPPSPPPPRPAETRLVESGAAAVSTVTAHAVADNGVPLDSVGVAGGVVDGSRAGGHRASAVSKGSRDSDAGSSQNVSVTGTASAGAGVTAGGGGGGGGLSLAEGVSSAAGSGERNLGACALGASDGEPSLGNGSSAASSTLGDRASMPPPQLQQPRGQGASPKAAAETVDQSPVPLGGDGIREISAETATGAVGATCSNTAPATTLAGAATAIDDVARNGESSEIRGIGRAACTDKVKGENGAAPAPRKPGSFQDEGVSHGGFSPHTTTLEAVTAMGVEGNTTRPQEMKGGETGANFGDAGDGKSGESPQSAAVQNGE